MTRFDASALSGSDFAGVEVRGAKFEASMLRGPDFAHADLIDANLSAIELAGASFRGSVLVRTDFSKSSLAGSRAALRTVAFDGARTDKLTYAGLKAMGADLSGVTVA